jgi:WD40 repeat protein
VLALAWGRGGRLIATDGDDGVVRLWEPTTGKVLHELSAYPGETWHGSLAFSPDGKTLAASGGWGDVHLWDSVTGNLLRRLHGPTTPVLSLTWSPDGKRLAGGGELDTTHVWDAASGRVQAVLLGLPRNRALAIDSTGHFRCSLGVENQLVYVVQTDKGQDTLTPAEFAKKYGWKNDPNRVSLAAP